MSSPLSFPRLALGAGLVLAAFLAGRWSVGRAPATTGAEATSGLNAATGARPAAQAASTREAAGERKAQAAALAERVAAPAPSLAAEDERQRLIEQWAEIDPQGALEFARTRLTGDRRAQAVAAILTRWARLDPAASWAWVRQHEPAATHHFDTLLEVFGRHDPATAARYAAEHAREHPADALEVHLAALLGITHTGNFAAARELAASAPGLDGEARAALHNFVAGQWARYAPADAAAWVMALPAGPWREQALIGLGESWSEVDPRGAADFAAQLPTGPGRKLALRQAIGKWLLADSVAASQWLLGAEGHADYDAAVASVATIPALLGHNVALALDWSGLIQDPRLRLDTVGTILADWYQRDRAAALGYLRTTSQLPDDVRAELTRRLATQFPE